MKITRLGFFRLTGGLLLSLGFIDFPLQGKDNTFKNQTKTGDEQKIFLQKFDRYLREIEHLALALALEQHEKLSYEEQQALHETRQFVQYELEVEYLIVRPGGDLLHLCPSEFMVDFFAGRFEIRNKPGGEYGIFLTKLIKDLTINQSHELFNITNVSFGLRRNRYWFMPVVLEE